MSARRSVRSKYLAIPIAALLMTSGTAFATEATAPTEVIGPMAPAPGLKVERAPADVPDGMWYDPTTGTLRTDALEFDAAVVAHSQGIGIDEALARLKAQQRMDEILVEAQDLYPELVGVRWVDGKVVAQFDDQAPKAALELLSTTGADVDSELVKYSTSKLEQLKQQLMRSLKATGVKDFAVAIDPVDQRIIASVSTLNGARMPDGSAISRQSLWATLPSELAEANVDIQVVAQPVFGATTTYGGADARVGTSFICTTAFTVSLGSTDGVATDGHCHGGLDSYRDWVTGITHSMTYRTGHEGAWGDFEWFTTTGTEVDDFYSDEQGSRRDVTGVTTTGHGTSVLWYGRVSNNNWSDTVIYLNVGTSGPDRLMCNSGYHVQSGDSGGPVYIGGAAAGQIYGWIYINGARRDCFSQARYIDEAIGVFIKQ
ncbi:MAG: hypothetical protein H0V07_00710 [Propionibacteriales bacterium]|nr:hypothetical protein [Propionibacteriales bacterium]